jgi:hypothetical protein
MPATVRETPFARNVRTDTRRADFENAVRDAAKTPAISPDEVAKLRTQYEQFYGRLAMAGFNAQGVLEGTMNALAAPDLNVQDVDFDKLQGLSKRSVDEFLAWADGGAYRAIFEAFNPGAKLPRNPNPAPEAEIFLRQV